MNEDIKSQFRNEGEPAFPSTENDNSAGSAPEEETTDDQTQPPEGEQTPAKENDDSTEEEVDKDDTGDDEEEEETEEETDTEETEEEKKKAGFAAHPRWKQREEDWDKRFNDQETRHTTEMEDLRTTLEKKIEDTKPEEAEAPTIEAKPSWFGGTDEEWASFTVWNDGKIDGAKKGAVQEIKTQGTEDDTAVKEATDYLQSEITAIGADTKLNPSGKPLTKDTVDKLLKIVLETDGGLVDSNGRWNYKAGWRILQGQTVKPKNPNLKEKKKIAANATDNKGGDTVPANFKTSEDFEDENKRPW